MEQKTETIDECLQQLYSLVKENRASYDFRQISKKIETLIRDHIKQGETDRKDIYINAASRLSRTIGKDVMIIESYQDRMHKKNAPKRCTDEYFGAVYRAYRQIKLDIHEVISYENKTD